MTYFQSRLSEALLRSPRALLLPTLFFGAIATVSCGAGGPDDGGGGSGSKSGAGGGLVIGDGGGSGDQPAKNCGDGILNKDEACDDGNKADDDGCKGSCKELEPGFTCSVPGEACRRYAKCGDGVISPPEQCDQGPDATAAGCSASCKIEVGYKCDGVPSVCTPTVCGDLILEGSESCEDTNAIPFDGCSDLCQAEPDCRSGACVAICGDGIVMNEECDDGNRDNGDGCTNDCLVEIGYECKQAPCEEINGACVLRIPAIFRDFSRNHSDFEVNCTGLDNGQKPTWGVVNTTLNSAKKPTLARTDNTDVCINNAQSFGQWYTNVKGTNGVNVGELVLFKNASGNYVNRWGAKGEQYNNVDGNPVFFPVDNAANDVSTGEYATANIPSEVYGGSWAAEKPAVSHNFSFTSEVTYWFQYQASKLATLKFIGDDDVWVFINGVLAVDVGGLHVPFPGEVTLNAGAAKTFNLVDGNVYEIKVFHAERRQTGSSFQLTLSDFSTSRSECLPKCGDGLIGVGEQCDDGVNDGGYNECQAGCILGGYCGDGVRQEGEICDDKEKPTVIGCAGCRIINIH